LILIASTNLLSTKLAAQMPFTRLAEFYFASASDLKSFGDTFVSFIHAILKKVINLTVSIQSIKLNKEFNHKLIGLGSSR
jgi:hypothetical protein